MKGVSDGTQIREKGEAERERRVSYELKSVRRKDHTCCETFKHSGHKNNGQMNTCNGQA